MAAKRNDQHVTSCTIPGQYTVELWSQRDGLFRVQYGQQIRSGLTYTQAAHEFGECVLHAAACAGFTDT